MSGHSKWANIKHRKAAGDSKRGKVFTKHAKLIAIAAKNGGDPEMNPLLRTAIENARAVNLPRENIERAIKKGTGELKDGANFEEIIYDGFGPGGVALYIQTLTDNKNRTLGNLKVLLNKNGGSLGEAGSVGWMFKKMGLIKINLQTNTKQAEEIELLAIDKGAIDIKVLEEEIEIYTDPVELMKIKTELEKEGLIINSAEMTYVAANVVDIEENSETFERLVKVFDLLEDDEDVSNIFWNANFV